MLRGQLFFTRTRARYTVGKSYKNPGRSPTRMSAKVVIRHVEGITVLEVSGKITLGEGGVTLRDAIQDALKTGAKVLILDMGGVNYMDSSGLGELTGAYTSAKNKGCELKLLHLTKKIDDLMQITKLATIFDIYTDEKAALASIKS
jgi:anti-sigma B factor antagonist